MSDEVYSDYLTLRRGPAPPQSNHDTELRLYADDSGGLRTILSDGTDAAVGGGGSIAPFVVTDHPSEADLSVPDKLAVYSGKGAFLSDLGGSNGINIVDSGDGGGIQISTAAELLLSGTPISFSGQTGEAWREVGAVGNPAFENGASNFGSGFEVVAFYKFADRVYLKGTFAGGLAVDAVGFTLPSGYRPAAKIMPGNWVIWADGSVQLKAVNAAGFITLDGIDFRVA